jgi:hypothetical protein
MSIGLIFWVLMLLWLVSYWGTNWGGWGPNAGHAGSLLLFILFFLLGWHDFGFIVHQ